MALAFNLSRLQAALGGVMSFAARLSWSLGGYALARLSVLVAGMEISRELGIPAFASLSYFIFTMNLLGSLSDLGISIAVVRYGVEAQSADGQAQGLRRVVACVQLATLVWCVALAAICLTTRVGSWQPGAIAILGAAALMMTWQATFNSVLQAMNLMRDQFIGNALFSAAIIAATLAAVVLGDVDLAKAGYIAAYLAQLLWCWRVIRSGFGLDGGAWWRFSKADVLAVVRMVSIMAVTAGLAALLPWYVSDRISRMAGGQTGLAIFAASMSIFGLIMAVPGRIGQLYFVGQLHQQSEDNPGQTARLRRAISSDATAAGFALLAQAGLIAVLWLLAGPILGRYGPVIAASRAPILAFMAIGLIVTVAGIIGNRIVASGHPALWMWVTLLQCLVTAAALHFAGSSAQWAAVTAYAAGFAATLLGSLPCYIYAIKHPAR